jgi:hypothetical protein
LCIGLRNKTTSFVDYDKHASMAKIKIGLKYKNAKKISKQMQSKNNQKKLYLYLTKVDFKPKLVRGDKEGNLILIMDQSRKRR